MKIMVTGSTGFVGIPLCLELARRGDQVNALARSVPGAQPLHHPNIRVYKGDLQDPSGISKAMEGCEAVFHVAAHTGIWSRDPHLSYKVNVEGTRNVLAAALTEGVRKVVITSTAGVMGPSPGKGVLVDEETNRVPYWATNYEKTKREAEKLAFSYLEKGLEVVVVNPSRIYGPGLLNESNSLTKMIKRYCEGKWRFIPGSGESHGNYVYIEDVVRGHLLAIERGKAGERYILGGENLSYNQLFQMIGQTTGMERRMFHLPMGPMLLFARSQEWMAEVFGKKPLIMPALVKKYSLDWNLSSKKAQSALGYAITPFDEGLRKTLEWLGIPQIQPNRIPPRFPE